MKKIAKRIFDHGAFFLVASLLANLLNLVFNFYLGRSLNPQDFSLVALFMSFLYAANIFFNALSVTANHSVGVSPENIRHKVMLRILSLWRKNVFAIGVIVSLVWVMLAPTLGNLWKVSPTALIWFIPIFLFGALTSIHRGVLQGMLRFTQTGYLFLLEAVVKLIVASIFIVAGLGVLAYLSIPASIIASCIVSLWVIASLKVEQNKVKDQLIPIQIFSRRFFIFSFLLGLSTLTFLSFDVILAKTFFQSHEAGAYALMALSGKILFLFSSLLEGLIISFVSNAIGEKKNTDDIFLAFFGISLVVVISITGGFLLFGTQLFSVFFGEKVQEIVPLLPIYIIAIAVFSLSHAIVFYHHARREYIFPVIASLSAFLLVIGTLMFHSTLVQFVYVLFLVSLVEMFIITIIHVRGKYKKIELEKMLLPAEQKIELDSYPIPTVTIGIPAYNEQHNIGNILRQVLAQEQNGFLIEKVIVISDGSTDDTVKVASEYLHAGVHVIPRQENRGLNYTQNEIIKGTTTDILVLLNADILLHDHEVISRLVLPILEGADLSAAWTKPLIPKTFLEKILCAGFDLKYFVYTHYKNGDNIYTCIGANRALSRRFYSNVEFPLDSNGEDQYLYLKCIHGGYKYRYAGSVKAYFRLPSVFSDYKKYARRIFQTQIKYSDIFGDLAKTERALPKKLILLGFLNGFLRQPINTMFYCVLHIGIQQWALRQPMSSTFHVSSSTKMLEDDNSIKE